MLQTLSSDAPHGDIFSAIERDGGVIVEALIDDETAIALLGDFEPFLEVASWGDADNADKDEFFGLRTKRLHGLVSKSPRMAQILTHPLLLAMTQHRLDVGVRCLDFRISTCELMAIGTQQTRQRLHRDTDAWYHMPLARPRPENLISANIALHDFTADNGATVVVPGSHKWHEDRRATQDEKTSAIMKRGSALLYSGEIIHGGGENRSGAVRTGLYVGYMSSWMRPTENQLQTNKPEDIYALPADTQRMLNVVPHGMTLIA